jgi:predicted Ser/Thr protein kinase
MADAFAKTNVLRWASGSDSQESDRFFQERVAFYARMMGSFVGLMYLVGIVVSALVFRDRFVAIHVHPSKIVNLILAVLLLGLWRFLANEARSGSLVRAIDVLQTVGIGIAVGVATAFVPGGYHLEFAGLLLLVLALVLRAAIVPSTPRRTAVVGFLCGPAVLVGGYQAIMADGAGFGVATPPVVVTILGVWCVAATAVSTVVSRVVYGLSIQVKEAMRLGQYTLREKLGEGGMGAVYRAEHGMLRRATAVKLLLPERVGADNLVRFEREVQTTSQLTHPNTVAIYDYGRTPEGVFYYAMEYIEGRTLEQLVDGEGPQPPARVIRILRQIAGSLREAHEAGLVHRDVKPGNVLFCVRGGIPEFVKVIDFGLAKRIDGGDASVTQVNSIAGTPLFMAPECVARPDSVGPHSDVYALGGVAYYLVTGVPPFEGNTVVEVCSHHLHTEPTLPSVRLGAPVPADLESSILRCLAKDAHVRPSDAELERLLRDCARRTPWSTY